jgi:hypothetical protein
MKGLSEPLEPSMTNLEDQIIDMAARVSHMKILCVDVLEAALKAFDAFDPCRNTLATKALDEAWCPHSPW